MPSEKGGVQRKTQTAFRLSEEWLSYASHKLRKGKHNPASNMCNNEDEISVQHFMVVRIQLIFVHYTIVVHRIVSQEKLFQCTLRVSPIRFHGCAWTLSTNSCQNHGGSESWQINMRHRGALSATARLLDLEWQRDLIRGGHNAEMKDTEVIWQTVFYYHREGLVSRSPATLDIYISVFTETILSKGISLAVTDTILKAGALLRPA